MKLIHIVLPFFAISMAIVIIIYRVQETKKPTNARRILLPPLGMSTGFAMFFYAPTQIPWLWALGAFLAGMIFLAPPLIYTSQFKIINGEVYLQRSKSFIVIILALFALRFGLHNYVEHHISFFQTGSVFFILAFGMLLPWRLTMYRRFKGLKQSRSMLHA